MLVSCQAYKSVSSKYNILYNGELFLDEGISQLKESYNENFWEIIPVLTENNITNTKKFNLDDGKTIDISENRIKNDLIKKGLIEKIFGGVSAQPSIPPTSEQ